MGLFCRDCSGYFSDKEYFWYVSSRVINYKPYDLIFNFVLFAQRRRCFSFTWCQMFIFGWQKNRCTSHPHSRRCVVGRLNFDTRRSLVCRFETGLFLLLITWKSSCHTQVYHVDTRCRNTRNPTIITHKHKWELMWILFGKLVTYDGRPFIYLFMLCAVSFYSAIVYIVGFYSSMLSLLLLERAFFCALSMFVFFSFARLFSYSIRTTPEKCKKREIIQSI